MCFLITSFNLQNMKAFFVFTTVFLSLFSSAQKFQLNIPTLFCGKTTESGEDEIYLLVTFRNSNGTTGNIRVPFNNHFDINDTEHNDKPNTATRLTIPHVLDFDLANNERIDIFCSIMEEDDGSGAQYNSAGVKVLRIANANNGDIFNTITGSIYKGILANIASTNHLSNSDDWIGAFSCRITKNNNALSINFKRIDNSNSKGGQTQVSTAIPPIPPDTQLVNAANRAVNFAFTGDGSKYNALVAITTSK